MNEWQYVELPSGLWVHRPQRFASFVVWAATHRQPRRAIWSTTALFGGVGCSLLRARNVTEAVFTYLLGFVATHVVMVPWFFADYRINGGWRR